MRDKGVFRRLQVATAMICRSQVEIPVNVISPAARAERLSSAARSKQRYDQLVQRVLKSCIKVAEGSDMDWY